jgi:hypothetical protein
MVVSEDVMPSCLINMGEGMWVNVRSMSGFVERGVQGELTSRRTKHKSHKNPLTKYQLYMSENMPILREDATLNELNNVELFKLCAKMWNQTQTQTQTQT